MVLNMIGFCDPAPEDTYSTESSSASATFAEFVQHLVIPRKDGLDNYDSRDHEYSETGLHNLLMRNIEKNCLEDTGVTDTPYAAKGIPWQNFKPRQEKNMTYGTKVGRWLRSLPLSPLILFGPSVHYPQSAERNIFRHDNGEELYEAASNADTDSDTQDETNPKYGDWIDMGLSPFPVSWIPSAALTSPHVQLCIDQIEPLGNISKCKISLSTTQLLLLRSEATPGLTTSSNYPMYPHATDFLEDEMYDLKSRVYTYNVLYHSRLESITGEPARAPSGEQPLRSDTEFHLRNMSLADVGLIVSPSQSLFISNYLPYLCMGLPSAEELCHRSKYRNSERSTSTTYTGELSDITNIGSRSAVSKPIPCPIGSGSPFRVQRRSRHHFRRPMLGHSPHRTRAGTKDGECGSEPPMSRKRTSQTRSRGGKGRAAEIPRHPFSFPAA